MLAGLETLISGRILIGDRDVTRLQPRDRDVAMVFQSYALYPHMAIAENIGYPLRIRNVGPDERKLKVAEVTAALEVDHLLDRHPRQVLPPLLLTKRRPRRQRRAAVTVDAARRFSEHHDRASHVRKQG